MENVAPRVFAARARRAYTMADHRGCDRAASHSEKETIMEAKNVGRRAFLKTAALGTGIAAAVAAAGEGASPRPVSPTRAVRYWMHGLEGSDPKAVAAALKEAGFGVVVAGGAPVIEAVNGAGMEAWLCGSGFPLIRDDDALKARDIEGAPQVWFGSGSPCCPEIQEAALASYAQMVKTEGVKGILVDGARFASPGSGLMPFFTDFSVHAEKRAGELGFDFALMKRDVALLLQALRSEPGARGAVFERFATPAALLEWLTGHPGVLDWFRFRRAHTTSHFKKLSEIIHGAGLRMGIYVFTPCLAPLVGQSYEDLREMIDVFAPMIYRNYPDHPGPACLNWELAELAGELGIAGTPGENGTVSAILSWAGFAGLEMERGVDALKAALPPEAVGLETRRARLLLGEDKELAPIIYIDDPLMGETARLVRENGADGVNFFVFKENWATMVRPALA